MVQHSYLPDLLEMYSLRESSSDVCVFTKRRKKITKQKPLVFTKSTRMICNKLFPNTRRYVGRFLYCCFNQPF